MTVSIDSAPAMASSLGAPTRSPTPSLQPVEAHPAQPPEDAGHRQPSVREESSDDLRLLARSRTSLLQFLTLVLIGVLGTILFLAADRGSGIEIPVLAIVALAACLYVLARERSLRHEQHELTVRLIARERQMTRMNRRIVEERARSQQLGDRLGKITSLYRAIASIHAVEEPQKVLGTMVQAACELVGADCGSLQLLDDTGSVLTVEATDGRRVDLGGEVQTADQGVAGWVLRHGEVLLLEGRASEDPRFDETPTIDQGEQGVCCSMVVPLSWHGQPFGVLNIGLLDGRDKDRFSAEDQSLVRIFGQHAALVVVGTRELARRRRTGPGA
ncbi:MAG: GAF domain-containing protein [Acidobacteria bacterium]|nr:MAG: GAF domain-containing protein [Acidobacteriota bacterium]